MPDDNDDEGHQHPPEEPDDYLPQIASTPLFDEPPTPPKAAPAELLLMLGGVSDTRDRQRIIDCYEEATEGLEGELLAQYGALFASILRAYERRQRTIVDALLPVLKQMQAAAKAQPAQVEANPQAAAPNEDLDQLGQTIGDQIAQRQEARFADIERTAHNLNVRVLVIACAACFFAGGFVFGVLWLLFNH